MTYEMTNIDFVPSSEDRERERETCFVFLLSTEVTSHHLFPPKLCNHRKRACSHDNNANLITSQTLIVGSDTPLSSSYSYMKGRVGSMSSHESPRLPDAGQEMRARPHSVVVESFWHGLHGSSLRGQVQGYAKVWSERGGKSGLWRDYGGWEMYGADSSGFVLK